MTLAYIGSLSKELVSRSPPYKIILSIIFRLSIISNRLVSSFKFL